MNVPTSDSTKTDAEYWKTQDPYIFQPAHWFFQDFAGRNPTQPQSVSLNPDDQRVGSEPNPVSSHGRIFRFNDNLGFLLVQFMRPQVWRVRFHSRNKLPTDFGDYNTRTIVKDTLTRTIEVLDAAEQVSWHVELKEPCDKYYVLQSVVESKNKENPSRKVLVQLWIHRDPFKITAIRAIKAQGAYTQLPNFVPVATDPVLAKDLSIEAPPGSRIAIVWQTKDRPLQWLGDTATVLAVEKPLNAKYTGFGEQGGRTMFKEKVLMNYFNFDNMRYNNVYGNGPYSESEPLYHSEPYWIEMNAHPGAQSLLATFVDNYSDVKVDLGLVDSTQLRVATRFNSFQCILIAGDDVAQIIRSYTSLIGRPQLKPRFVLGYHQGCYGYDTRAKVQDAVDKHRAYQIPLDGMHIDVDMQRDYRTFTIDTADDKFPNPDEMFTRLRRQGVKCSTNITPVVSCRPSPDKPYTTLDEGLKNDYFVLDLRDLDPSAPTAEQQVSLNFGGGNRYFKNPNRSDHLPAYNPPDDYRLRDFFNTGKPFRGGVDYGESRGAPGHYPNLNRKEVRVWWGKQYKYLFGMGLEFVWQDMTSPCMAEGFGDMKSWPFRLLLDSDGWSGDPNAAKKLKAIEIWSLYSYNLHKATFQGLQNLPARKGKRNFIIGRGSFAGAQRFAGLWTGDNASTWEFFNISVAQVLALGLAGVTIAGADVGGFEPIEGQQWADPELLIRWYCAYSLLPWFRNHYSAKKDKKLFQEPYAYRELQDKPAWQNVPEKDHNMYYSVLPICRYMVQLRYSLLQLLYDAMFENMISGLPIARSMIITDPLDSSLYQANQTYTRSQYLVRNDLLVAPALFKQSEHSRRKLYLPAPDGWYPMNLRPGTTLGGILAERLNPKVSGGTYVYFDCHIAPNEEQLPYVTPMYIREGAIIPQIGVRDSVPDRTRDDKDAPPNQITINVYPGKNNTYDMYLDDGVSRESAPGSAYLSSLSTGPQGLVDAYSCDTEANSIFRHVKFEQTTTRQFAKDQLRDTRRLTVSTPWAQYTDEQVKKDVGLEYRIVFWHASKWPAAEMDLNAVTVNANPEVRHELDNALRATVVWVPVDANVSATIEVSYPVSYN
ncbi:alpha-14-glucan lyase protein [Rutstroemia sp. NJR-2017a BVV2]|nr:alpha-14-glucan lyase protein [Rutstroemia sp. NJR-2017a BVV2]